MKKIILSFIMVVGILSVGAANAAASIGTTTITFKYPPFPSTPNLTLSLSSKDPSTISIVKTIASNTSIQVAKNLKIVAGGIYVPTTTGYVLTSLPQSCKIALAKVNTITMTYNMYSTPNLQCTTN